MLVEDELAALQTARRAVADVASALGNALTPIADAPSSDTDAVFHAADRLWSVEEDLACEETDLVREAEE